MTPTVCRCRERTRLTPCRSFGPQCLGGYRPLCDRAVAAAALGSDSGTPRLGRGGRRNSAVGYRAFARLSLSSLFAPNRNPPFDLSRFSEISNEIIVQGGQRSRGKARQCWRFEFLNFFDSSTRVLILFIGTCYDTHVATSSRTTAHDKRAIQDYLGHKTAVTNNEIGPSSSILRAFKQWDTFCAYRTVFTGG
jgi:hypothetical protein